MVNVRILQIKEQTIKLNNEVSISKGVSVQIGVAPVLLINDKDDTFALRIHVVYKTSEDVVLIDYAMLCVFSAENWKKEIAFVIDETNLIANNESLKRAMDLCLGCMRGALSVRTMNTKLEGAYLPDLPIEGVLSDLEVKHV